MNLSKNSKQDADQKEGLGKVESLIIFKCNCRCIMCSTGMQIDRCRQGDDYGSMRTFDEVISDIDRAVKMGAKGFAFSGGEPTLRKDLPLLARYAKSQGIKHIEVQSNGKTYYYKEYCKLLVNSGVNKFVISLHSHLGEIHDTMMATPGTFMQATQGIRNLNDLGFSVRINIVLTKLNIGLLSEHIEFLMNNFKIEEIRFTMVMLEGHAAKDPERIVPSIKDTGAAVVKAIGFVKAGVGVFIYNLVPCVVPGYEKYINDMGQLDTLLIGPDFEASLDEERKGKKVKSALCKTCSYDRQCYGIWRKYAVLYGLDELKPI